MSDNRDIEKIKELIDSFIAYRNVLTPLQESLKSIGDTYEAIRADLDALTKSFSGNTAAQLDKIHSTLNAQAKSGQEFTRKLDEYSASGEKYAHAVNEMTKKFTDAAHRIETVTNIEKEAESLIARLDGIISEKRANYNLKELQRSLETYNKNIEKITDFINRDVAETLKQNADKIEEIQRGNEELTAVVAAQGKTIAQLTTAYIETSGLLKKAIEGGSVNEQYLFDAFDKWAADRKVKTRKK